MEIRKDLYKRLFYITLCIILIIFFDNTLETFRPLAFLFFLIGMYQLRQIFMQSQLIIDHFFPPKTLDEKTTKSFDKFIYYFSTTFFITGLICQIFEIRNYDNTINGTKLFWTAGIVGIIIAIVLTLILKIWHPSVYYEGKRRYTVHFGLFSGCFLLIPAIVGFINHHYASDNKICNTYEIKRKGIGGGRSKEYFIYLTFDNNIEERFSIGKTRYENFSEGEKIELCMIRGKFGFDYVTEFNKKNQW